MIRSKRWSAAGGWTQTLLFAGALLVDWVGVYLTAWQGSWRLRSAGYWTERHGLFIILALGESVVAIGAGAVQKPRRCSAGRRCTWPGIWCSSSAFETTRYARPAQPPQPLARR